MPTASSSFRPEDGRLPVRRQVWQGYVSCRNKSGGGWSAPGTVRIEGGSVGFQIGGSTTDLIMLVMSRAGSRQAACQQIHAGRGRFGCRGSRGPHGDCPDRCSNARRDSLMVAVPGLVCRVALEGATLRQDLDDNAALYGKKLENREIVTSRVHARPSRRPKLLTLLNKYSPRERRSTGSSQ